MTDRVREYLRLVSDLDGLNESRRLIEAREDELDCKIQDLWLVMSSDEKTQADALMESVETGKIDKTDKIDNLREPPRIQEEPSHRRRCHSCCTNYESTVISCPVCGSKTHPVRG